MTNDGTTPDEADTGSTTSNAVGRRTLLRAAGGVAVGAAVVGKVSAQEAVVVTLSEETAMPGEQVSVSLAIEGEQEPETTVAGYELTIAYDDSLLFVEANGVDLPEPVVNQNGGNLQANTASSQGATVDLTAAEFVFTLDESASSGDVATLAVVDGKLSSADLETVGFTTTDGQVTASDGSGGGDGGGDDGGDDGGNDGGDDGGNDGGDDGGDDGGNDGGDDGGSDGGDDSGDDGGNDSGDDGGNDDGNDGGDDSGGDNGDDGGSDDGDDGSTGGNDGGSDGSNEGDGGNDDGGNDGSNDGRNDSSSNGDDDDGNNGGNNGDSGADGDESGDDDGTSNNGGDGFGPGFGVGGAVAALGSVGYMLRRRLGGEQDEE
jgi:PGF-CTERM protein